MTDCQHTRYKNGGYLTASNALKAMKANAICWMGRVIENCEECGKDIAYANVVQVKTVEEYLKSKGDK